MSVINKLPIGTLKVIGFVAMVLGATLGFVVVLTIVLYITGGIELVINVFHGNDKNSDFSALLLALFLGMIPGAWLGLGGFLAFIDEDKRHHFIKIYKK